MAEPSRKSPEMTKLLDQLTDRSYSIGADRCVEPPYGCGRSATEFRDRTSKKEFSISGLCQYCQDLLFGEE
jgi:hypothetical protein